MQEIQETGVQCLGLEAPLEKEAATHSSILAWKNSWREEPSRLQFVGLQRVGHDSVTEYTFKKCFPGPGERDRQDGGGIGGGDHFLSYKFIERTIER